VKQNRKNIRHRGFTIIELMVGVAISLIVISTVYYTWNSVNTHIARHSAKSQFSSEANRIIHTISSQIRKSPEVLSWSERQIFFLSPDDGDTLSYVFRDENLLCNGDTVKMVDMRNKITDFRIRDLEEDRIEEYHPVLFEISLIMTNGYDTLANSITVKPNKVSPKKDDFFGDDFW
jgi:prepilin-type N-terminal cleavage/methylation domain-containing protein